MNTKDTGNLFEKILLNTLSILKTNFDARYVQQKLFVFDIFTYFKNIWWGFSILGYPLSTHAKFSEKLKYMCVSES